MLYKRRISVLVAILLLAGCAGSTSTTTPAAGDSAKANAWKVLMTNKTLYDKTFTAMAVLDVQGKLPASTKANAIKAGNIYLSAHNAAVQNLLDGKTPGLDSVNAALDQFLQVSAPYAKEVK